MIGHVRGGDRVTGSAGCGYGCLVSHTSRGSMRSNRRFPKLSR